MLMVGTFLKMFQARTAAQQDITTVVNAVCSSLQCHNARYRSRSNIYLSPVQIIFPQPKEGGSWCVAAGAAANSVNLFYLRQ